MTTLHTYAPPVIHNAAVTGEMQVWLNGCLR